MGKPADDFKSRAIKITKAASIDLVISKVDYSAFLIGAQGDLEIVPCVKNPEALSVLKFI